MALSVPCDVAGQSHRRGSRNLVVPVVNAEIGMASQPNSARAPIGNGKPEIAYLGIGLFNPGFFRPEGRVFRGRRLNTHHSKVLCIHPNSASVEDLVLGQRLDVEDVARTGRHPLVSGQSEAVGAATARADKGEAVPYHPPVADPQRFSQKIQVAADSSIDIDNTDVNGNDWYIQDATGRKINLLTVDGTHYVILRWDLRKFAGKKVAGHGLLKFTTYSVQQKAERVVS
jgi:hypothetical protein